MPAGYRWLHCMLLSPLPVAICQKSGSAYFHTSAWLTLRSLIRHYHLPPQLRILWHPWIYALFKAKFYRPRKKKWQNLYWILFKEQKFALVLSLSCQRRSIILALITCDEGGLLLTDPETETKLRSAKRFVHCWEGRKIETLMVLREPFTSKARRRMSGGVFSRLRN